MCNVWNDIIECSSRVKDCFESAPSRRAMARAVTELDENMYSLSRQEVKNRAVSLMFNVVLSASKRGVVLVRSKGWHSNGEMLAKNILRAGLTPYVLYSCQLFANYVCGTIGFTHKEIYEDVLNRFKEYDND